MANIFFIHGAWSSRNSFNYFTSRLNYNKTYCFEYDPFKQTIPEIIDEAKKEMPENSIVVGHSLGGLIALSLHDESRCSKIVTLASPFSGIAIEPLVQNFVYSRVPVLKHLSPYSSYISSLKEKEYTKPIWCYITVSGFHPLMTERNDGVVTLQSQKDWTPPDAAIKFLNLNHYEILQSSEVYHLLEGLLEC